MATYRERREAKADRLREWADKREAKSAGLHEQAQAMADVIPFGQPILVGHYSEGRDRNYRKRIGAKFDAAMENDRKAESMASRASGIEDQLEGSIYDDDPDAVEQLTERVSILEAERERIKAYNVSCRKGAPDATLLDDRQRRRYGSHDGPLPGYVLQNLGGNIKRNRDRLAGLKVRVARAGRSEAAGGVLVEERGSYALVTFAEKPDRAILDALKAAGFRWGKGSWVGSLDRLPAEVRALVDDHGPGCDGPLNCVCPS